MRAYYPIAGRRLAQTPTAPLGFPAAATPDKMLLILPGQVARPDRTYAGAEIGLTRTTLKVRIDPSCS